MCGGCRACVSRFLAFPKHILRLFVASTQWTFRIFLIFFSARGEGKGESEAPGRGRTVSIEKPRKGGRGTGGGWGGVEKGVWGDWGGGGLIFFSGSKLPPSQGVFKFSEVILKSPQKILYKSVTSLAGHGEICPPPTHG